MAAVRWTTVESSQELEKVSPRASALMLLKVDDAQLDGLRERSNLKHLHLEAGFDRASHGCLNAVANSSGLVSLCLKLCNQTSDETLEGLSPTIETLEIITCHSLSNQSFQAVARLPKLKRLDLTRCHSVTDAGVEALLACRNLQHLVLRDCYQMTPKTVESIARMPKLRHLSLWRCPNFGGPEIRTLSAAKKLEVLDLYQWHELKLSDLEPLTKLPLKELTLLGNENLQAEEVAAIFPGVWLRGVG